MKRKPKTTSKPTTKGGSSINEDRLRTARWVVGFILLAFGVYTLWTLCAYLFTWQKGAMDGSSSGASGEWISSLLISDSFGLFGVLIPVMMIIFAFKIFMKRVKLYDHTLISFALIIILGSLSLGAIFKTDGDMFTSGWGGAFGITITQDILMPAIGKAGITVLLILSWILTAVFINVRVIELFSSLGNGIANKGKGLVDKVKRHDSTVEDDDVVPVPVPVPVLEPEPIPE